MAGVAKVLMSGRSQAVRLPKDCSFDCDEAEIARDDDVAILRPRRSAPWAKPEGRAGGLDDTEVEAWFSEGREQPAVLKRPELERLIET